MALRKRCRTQTELLKVLRARHSELDEEVQVECRKLRALSKELLLASPQQGGAELDADRREDENALFRKCFHPAVQQYRQLIRRLSPEGGDALSKCLANFALYVRDAIAFYEDLLERFRALPGDTSRSVHRTLIFVGDLARYRELHSPAARKTYEQAEGFYRAALEVVPHNGNPHNQLAVCATYSKADALVVYGYCRALMCAEPWTTSRENLLLLLSKNRDSVTDLTEPVPDLSRLRSKPAKERGQLVASCIRRLVRLHGILFTRTDLQTFEPGFRRTLELLSGLLAAQSFGDQLLVKLTAISIFSVESVAGAQAGAPLPTEVERGTSEEPMSFALALAFGSANAMCAHAVRMRGTARCLGPVGVFCDWLASRPHFLLPRLRASALERGAREAFWARLCELLNLAAAVAAPRTCADAALPEERELRSFVPLVVRYAERAASGRVVPEEAAAGVRAAKLLDFARGEAQVMLAEAGAAGFVPRSEPLVAGEPFASQDTDMEEPNRSRRKRPTPDSSFSARSARSAREEAEEGGDRGHGVDEEEDDDLQDAQEEEDEVIVFQPPTFPAAVAAPPPAFGAVTFGGWQPPQPPAPTSSLFAGATLGSPFAFGGPFPPSPPPAAPSAGGLGFAPPPGFGLGSGSASSSRPPGL